MLDECHVGFGNCSHEIVWKLYLIVWIFFLKYIKLSVNIGFAEKKYEMLSYDINI